MAQKLDTFPEGGTAREGYSRYPWDSWLDGSPWELSPGEDFKVTTKSFRSAAAQAARIRNGGIRTALVKRDKDGEPVDNVVIQFVRKNSPQADQTDDESLTG